MILLRLTCLMLITIFSLTSFAAKKSRVKESVESDKEQVISVPVPKSEIQLEPLRFAPPRPVEFEFGLSTWEPRNFTRSSYTGEESKFAKNNLPALSFNRLGQIATWDNGIILSGKVGLSYLSLARSADSQLANAPTGELTETVNIFMARAGAEGSWLHVLPWGLEPNVSFSVLPTFLTAEKSGFENGINAFGLPIEASLGILWRTGTRATLSRGDFSVGVAGQVISGSVGGSSLYGFGIEGELRISL